MFAPRARNPVPPRCRRSDRPRASRRPLRLAALASLATVGFVATACGAYPNGPDSDFVVANLLDDQQNSLEEPAAAPDQLGWETQGNAAIDRTDGTASTGDASLRVLASSSDPIHVDDSGDVRVATSTSTRGVRVSAGEVYAGWLDVTSSSTRTRVRCELRWYDDTGAIIDTDEGPQLVEMPSMWTTPFCFGRAPEDALFGALRLHITDASRDDAYYLDNAWMIQVTGVPSGGDLPVPDPAAPTAGAPAPTSTSTTAAPTTTVAPTTAAPTTAAPTTAAPSPTPTQPVAPSGSHPGEADTGPTGEGTRNLGSVVVRSGEVRNIDNAVVDRLEVHPGGTIVATNVRVNGAVVVVPRPGQAITKLHLDNVAVTNGMTVNVTSGSGLYWGAPVPVDIKVSNSWIRHPQGSGSDHTQALAGFGYPTGATFTNTTFILDGPFNGTGTAPVFWHGQDTTFDNCHFGFDKGLASYYTVYVRGANNLVRNSTFEKGVANHIYPNSDKPMATYIGNVDADTGEPVTP